MNWKRRAVACFIAAVMITASLNSVVAQNTNDNSTTSTAGQEITELPTLNLASYTPEEIEQYNEGSSPLLSSATTANYNRALKDLKEAAEKGNPIKKKTGEWVIPFNMNGYHMDAADTKKMVTQLMYENPELFYIIGYQSPDGIPEGGIYPSILLTYSAGENDLAAQKATFNENIQEALSNIDRSWPIERQILVLHDYIVTTTHYDHAQNPQDNPFSYNAYGVLGENRMATCNGYALAFNALMDAIGVENQFIGSKEIVNGQSIDHAWSKVKIGSDWYNVDPTWDDDGNNTGNHYGPMRHDNFLVSDAKLTETGHGSPASASNPDGWAIGYGGAAEASNNRKFESGQPWNGISSTMLYNNDQWYYVKNGRLYAGDTAIGSPNARETFAQWDDRIYYATDTAIRSINFDGTDDRIVEGGSVKNVNGMCVRNGTIYYQIDSKGADGELTIKKAPKATGISMVQTPRSTYKEGQEFDYTGGVIRVTYSDNSYQDVTLTPEMCTNTPDMNKLGTQTIGVSYAGFKTSFKITIEKKSLTGINFSKGTGFKSDYKIGQDLDLTGANIELLYDNGKSEIVPITPDLVSGYDKNVLGPQTINVSYQGKHTNFLVTVYDKLVQELKLVKAPAKTEYLEGTELDLTGAEVHVFYDNGTDETCGIAPQWCTGYDKNKVGEQTVTVNFNNASTSFKVNVIAKSAVSYELKNQPLTTEYIEGQEFSSVGATMLITYNNGTTDFINITNDMCSGMDMSKVGEQTVTVSYGGKDVAKFTINVRAKQVEAIELSEPSGQMYMAGEELSLEGGYLTVSYDNGTQETVDLTKEMCSAVDMNKAGEQTVTVTYAGKEAQFKITVVSREAVDAVIAQIDAIDLDNLTVDDKDTVVAAIDAYNALTPFETGYVTNVEKLVEARDKLIALLYPAIEVTEGDITVSSPVGGFPKDTTIAISNEQAKMNDSLKKLFGEKASALKMFDLSVESKNELDGLGMMTVQIKLGDETERLALAYLDSDGSATEITEFTIEDGILTFTTETFGRYVLVQKAEDTTPTPADPKNPGGTGGKPTNNKKTTPKTGDANPLAAVLPALMLSASAAVLLKKKRGNK